ncbi:subtilisin-like protein [Epithele typhae]|uniref:subtilisin-like protein n=1 Tax=Epithele typhae TaxID=378194 RepID=UPI0020083A98|nr:subtilisin-like protein [Epithele typhae]KAH9945133.1 subtilisin-like protein [Epithele typhae]
MSLVQWVLCAVAVAATVVPGAHSRAVPRGWSLHRRADPQVLVPVKLNLAQSNVHNLESYLLDIADPASPNYGKHWTPSQVAKTFRPSQDSVDAVHSWLVSDHGIEPDRVELTPKGDAIRLLLSVAEAERLLDAEYFVYRHEDGKERVGCHDGYTLPETIAEHVDFVSPSTNFNLPSLSATRYGKRAASISQAAHESGAPKIPVSAAQLKELEATGCDQAVTLDCLRALYNFDYTLVTGNQNNVSVFELQGEAFQQSDLDKFFQMFRPDQVGNSTGNLDGAADLGEATLDIELMMGLLGSSINLQLYQVGTESRDPIDEFLAALDAEFCNSKPIAGEGLSSCGDIPTYNVVSISYHLNPDIQDPTISPTIQRQCTEIGKLTLTGMTFVVSSGDGGVGYSQAEECLVNGTLTAFAESGSFVGQFPASCPFVTAVGATQVGTNNSVEDPESATFAFPSGAGFSNNFAMPSFQADLVNTYITDFAPAYGPDVFNRSGRAYPDVSANGFPTIIIESGRTVKTGGTSASAPIFASFVAAVNDARIAAGKSAVGWINPALYSTAFNDAFNDITNGTNPGCGTDGFPAAPGWDPITGRGTPNFPNMLSAFLALP